jgi:MoxR-like ATPase
VYKKTGNGTLAPWREHESLNNPALYLPSDGLVDAVNVALALGQQLLLTGEPGTGKTQLAYHLAHFFGLGKPLRFNAQTVSVALDLFYSYDALGHFQYNQNNATPLTASELEATFIHYNALGEAIKSNSRRVVLIDEIDKAPRDLPNNILAAVEDLSFEVPQINRTYTARKENRPVIILTSNSEKNLPDAFLRRVVYFHIEFPDAATLLEILALKALSPADLAGKNEAAITALKAQQKAKYQPVVTHFNRIRTELSLRKKPATAELIFWVQYLQQTGFEFAKLDDLARMTETDRAALRTSYAVLAKNQEDLEALHALGTTTERGGRRKR